VTLHEVVETIGKLLDVAGIAAIVAGAVAATVRFATHARSGPSPHTYTVYRRSLGRAILLGLEFLVAGDIIRSVAITPTFASVGVLGAIVVIRTILSISLHVETEGRWPWQARDPVPDSEPLGSTPV
jgi:uncharacterized membrane protein